MSNTDKQSVQMRLESITARAVRGIDPASLYGVAVRLLALAAVGEPKNANDSLDAAQRDFLADEIAELSSDIFTIAGVPDHG